MIPDILSDNFRRSEFECNGVGCCGHSAPVMPELINILQPIRAEFNTPIRITSGFRCIEYNGKAGGSSSSWHTVGGAADCSIPNGVTLDMIFSFARQFTMIGGFGFYDEHFHVDIRPRAAGRITVWDRRR